MKIIHTTAYALLGAALSLASCTKDKVNGPERDSSDVEFFIAASSGEGNYLLAVPSVDEGEVSIVGQGLETDSYTAWVFPNKYTGIGLKYQKGDPGIGIGVGLGPNGNIMRTGSDFQIISRFTSYGPFQEKVLTVVQGVQVAGDDKNLYSTFNFIDPAQNNAVRTVTRSTTNLTGNGEYATLSGVVPFGSDEFLSAIVPFQIGKDEEGALTTTPTNFADSVWVAAFDADLNVKRIYRDDRLGYASGRFRSQFYSSIADDGQGNVYVFSPANDETSTRPAGALRILAGEQGFDKDYLLNLDGFSTDVFQKVYHIAGDWFALAYVRSGSAEQEGPAQPNALAVVNVATKAVKWVDGLPNYVSNPTFGLPIAEDGKLYIPVSQTDALPAIYTIDPTSASASRGLAVHADNITAIGKLSRP